MKLKALVVSHHKRFRRDLSELIELIDPCIEVASEVSTAGEALLCIGTAAPELILVDLSLRSISALELTARICACWPETAVIVIGNEPSDDYRAVVLEAGAIEYVDVLEVSTQLPEALQRLNRDSHSDGRGDASPAVPVDRREPNVVGLRSRLRTATTGPRYGPFTAWQYVHLAIGLTLIPSALNLQAGHRLEPERTLVLILAILGILFMEVRQFSRARQAVTAYPTSNARGGMIRS